MTRLEEIEERKLELRDEIDGLEDLDKVEELEKEVDALNEEVEQINETQEQEEVAKTLDEPEVKAMAKEVSVELKKEEIKMETRNTKEYIDAFAEYIKTGEIKALDVMLSAGVGYKHRSGFTASARYNLGMSELAGNFAGKVSTVSVSIGWLFKVVK